VAEHFPEIRNPPEASGSRRIGIPEGIRPSGCTGKEPAELFARRKVRSGTWLPHSIDCLGLNRIRIIMSAMITTVIGLERMDETMLCIVLPA
jgi:hypothetical protein